MTRTRNNSKERDQEDIILVRNLFTGPLEAELAKWIQKFGSAIELLNALPQLFAKLDHQPIDGKVMENVSISGPVHIGSGSVIHSGVVIDGPVIIAENVSVRSHSHIRKGTYLGSKCVVGHSADIKASLCMNESKIQDGTFVGDSILGYAARIGSGAILANRKFNQSEVKIRSGNGKEISTGRKFMGAILGDYVRIGANAVLSPGTILGPHTWVGSGVVLHGTYGSDLFINVKQDLSVRKKKRVMLQSGHGDYEQI